MSLKKTVIISALCGLSISGLGLILVGVGGYGPCGPASTMATVGAYLSIFHAVALFGVLPSLEDLLLQWECGPANFVVLLLIPSLTWTLVTCVLLTGGRIVNTLRQKSSDGNGGHAS